MYESSLDALFRALASSRRRAVCQYFRTTGDEVAGVDELAEYVVEAERAERTDDPSRHRVEVAVELRHAHLPLLADTGAVEFDPRGGSVRYLGDSTLGSLLREVAEDDVVRL
jgi:hypothetical protein